MSRMETRTHPHRWLEPAANTLRCEDCNYVAAASYLPYVPACGERWRWRSDQDAIGLTVDVDAVRYEVQPMTSGQANAWTAWLQEPHDNTRRIGQTYREALEAMNACSRTAGEPTARHTWPASVDTGDWRMAPTIASAMPETELSRHSGP